MGISKSKLFSSDVLCIVINGKDNPNLTLVDLPGLFTASTAEQPIDGAGPVRDMVRKYLESEKSIIIAVVSARADSLTSLEITQMTRDFQDCTLGLITKPDTLPAGSDSEASIIQLAQNGNIKYGLGWHVLRNRCFETRDISSDERDRNEEHFFASGKWATLDRDIVGVSALRLRLSNILKDRIAQHLPKLQSDVSSRLFQCQEYASKLGKPRASLSDKREYLLQVSSDFSSLMEKSISGYYNDPFLQCATGDNKKKARLLGAVVHQDMTAFADHIREKGFARHIGGGAQKEYMSEIKERFASQAHELHFEANMAVVSQLLLEQSSRWPDIISNTIEQVIEHARTTTFLILQHVAPRETADKLNVRMEASIDLLAVSLRDKISELLQPYMRGRPVTYNKQTLAELKQKFEASKTEERPVHESFRIHGNILQRMWHFQCSSDHLLIYKQSNLNTLIDNVYSLAIDAQLLQKLPGLFNGKRHASLLESEIEELAAESQKTIDEREQLDCKMHALQSAASELRRFTRYSSGPAVGSAVRLSTTLPIRERSPSPSISISSPATTISTPSSVADEQLGRRTSEQGPAPLDYYSLPSSSPRPRKKKIHVPPKATVEDECHA